MNDNFRTEALLRYEQTFAEDCGEIVKQEFTAGRISRRRMLGAMAALGLLPAGLGSKAARAAEKELVMCNWGGDAVKAFTTAFGAGYEKATARKLVVEGAGPAAGKIRAMVQAGNVVWDLCDSGASDMYQLAGFDVIEPMDYTVIDKAKMLPGFAYEHGCVNYTFSTVIAYNAEKYKSDPPKTMADFWDTKKYPGRRMLRKRSLAMLECALVADGVPMDKVYPIDLDRALDKIKQLKDNALYWSSGSESQSLLRDGEADMGLLWHTRANLLKRDTDGRIDWTFNEGLLQPGIWVIPKGNPAGANAAMEGIAVMQDPAAQITLLDMLGNGPANPAAQAMVSPELAKVNPSAPQNVAVQLRANAEWWGKNAAMAEQKYADLITS